MNSVNYGLVLLIFSLFGVVTFFKTFKRRKENPSAMWLLALIAAVLAWSITYALFFLLPNHQAALFFHQIRYAAIMFAGWLIYLFLYKTLKHRMFEKSTVVLLMMFPVINLLVLLTNGYTGLFIKYYGIVEINGCRATDYQYGVWFIFHCLFSYLPLFLGAGTIIKQFLRLPVKHRAMAVFILLGMLLTIATTLISVFDLLIYPVDLTPLVIQGTLIIFYYTLFNSRSLEMIFASRNVIFENSENIFLVIDTDGNIVDYNLRAKEIAKSINIDDLIGIPANGFVARWQNTVQCHYFAEEPSIFTIVEDETDTPYQIQRCNILGKNGEIRGSYMEIKNIKPIMTLIHMLQDAAYYDHLTGLPNRNYFLKKLGEIDNPLSYPLCVMVGDINGLKYVNDNYGHVKGDELLKCVSHILLNCAPPNTYFFRVGGDEFIGLLPNTNEGQAERFVNAVEACCNNFADTDMQLASIALGYKIKHTPEQEIGELIKAADFEMYTTKRNRRNSPR